METIAALPSRQAFPVHTLDKTSAIVVNAVGVIQETVISQISHDEGQDGSKLNEKPTVVVDEVFTPQENPPVDSFLDAKSKHSINSDDAAKKSTVLDAFLYSRKHWVVDPVMATWDPAVDRISSVLAQVEALHELWSSASPGPFHPISDPLWTSTATVMRKAGLPLHNNNINMPEDIDEGWPFHFKEAERLAVMRKGSRVGDSNPAGYVCQWSEANHYCIRALQQELRRMYPTRKPLLVACKFDDAVLRHITRLLGLEFQTLDSEWAQYSPGDLSDRMKLDDRPLIFAASLCNDRGESDDFGAIRQLAKSKLVWVHVDASRNFDYMTTLSPWSRARLRIPKLMLDNSNSRNWSKDKICASTIVAGGMSGFTPCPVVAMKPRALGNLTDRRIQYIDASDSTVSGSRDSLAPLLLGMQEQRFGKASLQTLYRRCYRNRVYIAQLLTKYGLAVKCPQMSLDLIIQSSRPIPENILRRLGVVLLGAGSFLATVQPSLRSEDVCLLLQCILTRGTSIPSILPIVTSQPSEFSFPSVMALQLEKKVSHWRERVRDSAGYPFNQGPYTALGPVIGHFLDKYIPHDWVCQQADKILTDRKRSFGVKESDMANFGAAFTTGSTMGNQIGVHAAIDSFPHNYIYVSSAAHYSVTKALMDNDSLTGRWDSMPTPRFAVIPTIENGQIDCEALVQKVTQDRQNCLDRGQKYGVTLFVTLGTTFVGANDDVLGAQRALQRIGQEVSYIHIDGALDFGFSNNGIILDHPSSLRRHLENGVVAAQGVTLSHHKAYGMMVSGEVLCFDPLQQYISSTCPAIDPRAVFEVYFFQQMYTRENLKSLKEYSLQTAALLHSTLERNGIYTKLNERSSIVVVERPPSWIVEEFGLRCEGNWAHYITMPHINCAATERFINAMTSLDKHLSTAVDQFRANLEDVFGQGMHCERVRPHHPRFKDALALAAGRETKSYPSKGSNPFKDESILQEQFIRTGLCVVVYDSNSCPAGLLLVRKAGKRKYTLSSLLVRGDLKDRKGYIVKVSRRLIHRFFDLLQVQIDL